MFFHNKTKNLEEDPCATYQVLCGIEEEFLIINNSGTLVEAADDIMVKGAELLEQNPDRLEKLRVKIRSLDAEPSPAQIEYVTLPLPPEELEKAIIEGRQLIIDIAKELGYKILAQSLHPIQSAPNPAVGTHINISMSREDSYMRVEEIKAVYDYFWNYLPEFIAITANSPLYRGSKTDVVSNRFTHSNVLKLNGFSQIEKLLEQEPALIRQQYYGRMRYELKIGSRESEVTKRIIANSKGERLVDITPRGPLTNISDDKEESLFRNRVELRMFDVQPSKDDVINLAYLCCASALHAKHLQLTGEIYPDQHHKDNIEEAVYNGFRAKFIRDNRKVSVYDSLKKWVNETKEYQELLGIGLQHYPDRIKRRRPLQDEIKVDLGTPSIEKLRQNGKVYVIVQLSDARTVQDENGRQRRVDGGAKIEGKLTVDYDLSYDEHENLVTNFRDIQVRNVLQVKGITVPLKDDDRILRAYDRSELMASRLFGGFGF